VRVRAASPEEVVWVAERVGFYPTSQVRGMVAVDASGRVRAGVAFDGWTQSSAQCHMASESPMAWRTLLPEAMRYAFLQAGRLVLVGTVRESNTASRALTERFGFSLLARLEDGAQPGEALLFYQLRREQCRYLTPHQEAA